MAPSIGQQDNQHSPGQKVSHTSQKVNSFLPLGDWMINYPHSTMGNAGREPSLLPDHPAGHTEVVWDNSHLAALSASQNPDSGGLPLAGL